MAFVTFLVLKFNHHYGKRPVLTTMMTNAVRIPEIFPFEETERNEHS